MKPDRASVLSPRPEGTAIFGGLRRGPDLQRQAQAIGGRAAQRLARLSEPGTAGHPPRVNARDRIGSGPCTTFKGQLIAMHRGGSARRPSRYARPQHTSRRQGSSMPKGNRDRVVGIASRRQPTPTSWTGLTPLAGPSSLDMTTPATTGPRMHAPATGETERPRGSAPRHAGPQRRLGARTGRGMRRT